MGDKNKIQKSMMIFAFALLLLSAGFSSGCRTGRTVNGWVCHGKGWYKFFNSNPETWHNAIYYCGQERATLATIHSYYENKVVADLVGSQRAWIGGFREDANTFYWPRSSNTYMNYKNFFRGEPNNYGGREYCLEIYGSRWIYDSTARGKWNDNDCTKNMDMFVKLPEMSFKLLHYMTNKLD